MKKLQVNSILFRVREGDTLEDIADIFNVTKDYILKNNHMENEKLERGDVIFIPKTNVKIHIVQPLESTSSIAQKYNIDENLLKTFNNITSVFIGQKILIP